MADSCDIPRAPGDAFPPFPAGRYPPAFRPGSRPGGFSAFSGTFMRVGRGKDAGRTRRDLREDGKPWYTISLEFCRAGDLRREEQRPAGRGRGLIWYGRN